MVTSVVSVKGSSGASTVLLLMAKELSKKRDVIIIDINDIKQIDIFTGLENKVIEKYEMQRLTKDEFYDEFSVRPDFSENIHLVKADLSNITKDGINNLTSLFSDPVILIDVSSSMWKTNLDIILGVSAHITAVSTEENSSLRAMDAFFNECDELIRKNKEAANPEISFIINKKGHISSFSEDDIFEITENSYLGHIRYDKDITEIVDQGRIFDSEYNKVELEEIVSKLFKNKEEELNISSESPSDDIDQNTPDYEKSEEKDNTEKDALDTDVMKAKESNKNNEMKKGLLKGILTFFRK